MPVTTKKAVAVSGTAADTDGEAADGLAPNDGAAEGMPAAAASSALPSPVCKSQHGTHVPNWGTRPYQDTSDYSMSLQSEGPVSGFEGVGARKQPQYAEVSTPAGSITTSNAENVRGRSLPSYKFG